MGGRIFVSYRRDDVAGDARSIRDRLARKLGESNVFMDVDNLLAGQRFDRELDKALKQCDVLVAVIGPQWMRLLSDKTASGERDYVRDEIAAALKRDIVVIPALVGREGHMPSLPRQADLPEDIRDLVQYQKHSIVHESFGRNMDDLVAAIETVRRSAQPPRRWKPLAAAAAGALLLVLFALGGLSYFGVPEMPTLSWSGAGGSRPATEDAARKDAELAAKKATDLDTKKRADEETKRAADQEAKKKADDEAKRAAEVKAARDAAAECDRLAASPTDPTRPTGTPGVFSESINGEVAWAACSTAMRLNPNVPRLMFQAGRSAQSRKDFVTSADLYRRAADQGSAAAVSALGMSHWRGDGVAQDYGQAKNLFEKAATLGNTGAMTNLGNLYEFGQGVTLDLTEARKRYEKAAALGDARGMKSLGVLYADGKGVARSPTEARKWYEKAAALGDPAGMTAMGFLYHTGDGLARDMAEARRWYEKAAELGDSGAMNNLGVLAELGESASKSPSEAKKWYEKSAALGEKQAMFNLGNLYENGVGVPKNIKTALEWYQQAANAGNADAKEKLTKLK